MMPLGACREESTCLGEAVALSFEGAARREFPLVAAPPLWLVEDVRGGATGGTLRLRSELDE